MSNIKNLTDPSALASLRINLAKNQRTKSDLLQRLSTGINISSSGTLALVENLKADKRLANVAIQNISEGISFVQIRDDGIDALQSILQQQKELAEQAATGTLTSNQRSALNTEFQELTTLTQNITSDTEFNDINLLNQSKEVRIQAGIEGDNQAGANNPNQIVIGTGNFYEDTQSIEGRGISTQDEAQSTLAVVEQAISDIETRAGAVQGKESVLDIAVSNMTALRNELGLAVDQITSVDVAQDVTKLAAAQIIENQQMALYAQANQTPQRVLELLGGIKSGDS